MNPAPPQADTSSKKTGAHSWLWAFPGLAVCLVAISSQSLWIDEAFMASKASQPTLADWWHMMPRGSGSDLQMPLYMIYMWGFAKMFGFGEWTLRAANIPWFVAGVAAFIPAFPKPQRFAAAAVTLLCPFAWYYLNEARPYAMQLGSSLIIFAAIYRLGGNTMLPPRHERNWIVAFWLGVIALCGSSLLGVIWAGAAFLSLLLLLPLKRLIQLFRAHWLSCVLSGAFLAALAVYYIWTIKYGTHSLEAENQPGGNLALSAVKSAAHFRQGSAGGTKLQNLAFVLYELLGFTGLGPGKLEIRTERLAAFRHFAPQLALYAVTLCALFLLAVSRLVRSQPPPSPLNAERAGVRGGKVYSQQYIYKKGKLFALALVALLPMLLLMAAGNFLGFLILGRHCTPLLPVLLFVSSLGLLSACASSHAILKLLAGVFIILSLISCLSLRFALRHEKDDYRDAAHFANAALHRGQIVWWSAGDDGAAYYHLPLAVGPEEKGRALLVLNSNLKPLIALPAPDLIITSKPDLYDSHEALADYIRNNPYSRVITFPAFAVWERKTTAFPKQ